MVPAEWKGYENNIEEKRGKFKIETLFSYGGEWERLKIRDSERQWMTLKPQQIP